MYLSNLPGIAGVALAVAAGYWLDGLVPRDARTQLCALLLGLYGLTFDRCEVPGLIAAYRANVRDYVDALGIAFGEAPVGVERTRRLCMFVIPVAFAPLLNLVFSLAVLGFTRWVKGSVSRADVHLMLALPLALIAVWAAYARVTARLRLRPGGGYGGMSFTT